MLRRLICRLEAIGIKGQRADLTALSALGICTLQNPDGALPHSSRNMYLLRILYLATFVGWASLGGMIAISL